MNLKSKMTLAVSVLVITIIFTMAFFTLTFFEGKLRYTISDQQLSTVAYVADDIDNALLMAQELLAGSAAIFPTDALNSPAKVQKFLQSRTELVKLFNNRFFVIAPNGELIVEAYPSSHLRSNFADEPFFRTSLATLKPAISDPMNCCLDGALATIAFSAPVLNSEGKLVAMMVGTFDLRQQNLLSRFTQLKIGKNGFIRLFSSNYTILTHSAPGRIVQKASPGTRKLINDARQGFVGTKESIGLDEQPMLTSIKKLKVKDWVLAASYPKSEAYQPIQTARTFFLFATIIGIAAVILSISCQMNYLTKPISVFSQHIAELPRKAGDDKFITIKSGDEIAQLAESFNSMVEILDRQTVNLLASEERFRGTFEQAAVGIAHVTPDGRFIRNNQQFCIITGYNNEEMGQLNLRDITHQDDSGGELGSNIQDILAGKTNLFSMEKRSLHKNGASTWLNLTVSLVRETTGEPNYMIVVMEDISLRKKVEDDLRHMNIKLEERVEERTAQVVSANEALKAEIAQRVDAQEEVTWLIEDLQRQKTALEAANEELEAFSFSVSHDLRTPLKNIDGFSLALIKDYSDKLDNVGQEYLQRVHKSCQRMKDLINDLLSLSHISRSEMKREPVDLTELCREIANDFGDTDDSRDVQFIIADKMLACGDPRLLQIAMQNLISNAWKYSSKRESSIIEIGEITRSGKITYFIRDNGAGFDMNYADRLFTPFQRLHKESEFEGTGVGLATVQRIIQRHGGTIWAEAEVGKGAAFFFTIG